MAEKERGASAKMVGALIAGLKVLRYLARSDVPVGVSQVARDLDISASTCFNLLRTLVQENLVEMDPVKKTYSIGLGLLEFTKGLTEGDRLIQFLRPRLEELAQSHQVTCTLWRRFGADRVVMAHRADTDAAVRVHMSVGQRLPMFIGALGRTFAGHSGLSRGEMKRQFDALRWENPPDFESYWDDIQSARAQGYAIDRDNFTKGVTSVAAPILNVDGQSVMAISAIGFSGQFSDKAIDALVADLKRHADEIGAALSGIPVTL